MDTKTQQNCTSQQQKVNANLKKKRKMYFNRLLPVIDNHSELFKQPDHSNDWESHYREFRAFVKKLGFKLKDFDGNISIDLKSFLICYYLIAEKKALGYIIDYTYGQLLENAYYLFMSELDNLIQSVSVMSEKEKKVFGIILKLGGSCLDDLGIVHSVPPISVAKAGFLAFLTCRGKSRAHRVEAILAALYEPYVDCEPEEWLAYLFQSQNPEALPMLRRILDALMGIIMSVNNQPDAKSRVATVV